MIVWIQHWLLQETGPFLDNSPAAIRFSVPEFPTIHSPAGIEIGMLDCVSECSASSEPGPSRYSRGLPGGPDPEGGRALFFQGREEPGE